MLVVDDDQEVHAITRLVLSDLSFKNRSLNVLSAYSAKMAREMLEEQPDIAVILLDVVMETDDAGLRLARAIRDELGNAAVRIILRTGQPGLAPERDIILRYDINDYKEKSELTAEKLFTSTVSALRSYSDIVSLDQTLEEVEQKRALLKISEERYRTIVQAQTEAICRLTTDFTLTFANSAMAGLASLNSRSTLIGQSLLTAFKLLDPESMRGNLELLRGGQEIKPFHCKVLVAGETRGLHWTARALRGSEGEVVEMLLVGRDMTDQLIAEQAALQSAKLATLGEMTTGIAHELNQPLAAIALTAQGLEQGVTLGKVDDAMVVEKMRWIYENAQRMRRITDHLRAFGRKASEDSAVFNAAESVAAAAALMQAPLKLRNITVRVDLPLEEVLVFGHVILFEQVLINLLGNAADAIDERAILDPENPRSASIKLCRSEGHLLCSIEDSGVGVPPALRERVFENFFTTKPHGKGTGMGLALSREIIRKMSGEIWMEEPKHGTGAVFLVKIPLYSGEQKADRDQCPNQGNSLERA